MDLEPTNKYAWYLRANYDNPDKLTFEEYLEANPELVKTPSEYRKSQANWICNGVMMGLAAYEIVALAKPTYDYYSAKFGNTLVPSGVPKPQNTPTLQTNPQKVNPKAGKLVVGESKTLTIDTMKSNPKELWAKSTDEKAIFYWMEE